VTAASPSAVPVAPPSDVPYQRSTTGTRTQLKAAQRTTSVTESSVRLAGTVPPGIDHRVQRLFDASVTARRRMVTEWRQRDDRPAGVS
jgi:hypothetical protein